MNQNQNWLIPKQKRIRDREMKKEPCMRENRSGMDPEEFCHKWSKHWL